MVSPDALYWEDGEEGWHSLRDLPSRSSAKAEGVHIIGYILMAIGIVIASFFVFLHRPEHAFDNGFEVRVLVGAGAGAVSFAIGVILVMAFSPNPEEAD